MNIGQVAKASGVNNKMIRYYESIGLIKAALRSESGYRQYEEADIHRLKFIKSSRDLGFSVSRIASLLALWQDQQRKSADVKKIVTEHIGELQQKIFEMQQIVGALEHLAHCCAGDDRPDCPILSDFDPTVMP